MSLKQWIAVDQACHPKCSPHSQILPITSGTGPRATHHSQQPHGNSHLETLQVLAESYQDGLRPELPESL